MTDFIKDELTTKIYADFANHLSATDAKEIELLARSRNIPVNILHQFLICAKDWTPEQHEMFLNNDHEGLRQSLGVDDPYIKSLDDIPNEIDLPNDSVINFETEAESEEYWNKTHPPNQTQEDTTAL